MARIKRVVFQNQLVINYFVKQWKYHFMRFVYHFEIRQIWVVSHGMTKILRMALLTDLELLYLFYDFFSPFYESFISFYLRCLFDTLSIVCDGCALYDNLILSHLWGFLFLFFLKEPICKFDSNLVLTFFVAPMIFISLLIEL